MVQSNLRFDGLNYVKIILNMNMKFIYDLWSPIKNEIQPMLLGPKIWVMVLRLLSQESKKSSQLLMLNFIP